MADESLNYEINTTANTQGQKQAAQGFKEVGNAAQEAGKKSEEAGQQDEQHAKKTTFLNLKKAELKKLVRQLGHEFPLAGMAAKAMLNPMMVMLTVIIGLFVKCKQALEDWNEELDEAAEKNAQRDFVPGIEAQAKAMDAGKASAAEFAQSLKAMGTNEDAFTQGVKRAIDRLHEFIAAQAEVNSAVEANELAKINLAEKMGQLTPEAAIVARSKIREEFRAAADQLKTTGENQELGLKQTQLAHDVQQGPALQADAFAKMGVETKLEARLARANADLAAAKAKLEELGKKQIEALAKRDKEQGVLSKRLPGWSMAEMASADPFFAKVAKSAETAAGDYERQKKNVESLEKDLRDIPEKLLPKAKSDAAIAKELATKNAQDIVRLQQEIPAMKEALAVRQDARAVVSDIKAGTAAMETEGELFGTEKGKTLQQAINTANTIEAGEQAKGVRGRKRTPEEDAAIQRENNLSQQNVDLLRTVAEGVKGNGALTHASIKTLADVVVSQTGSVEGVYNYVKSIEGRVKSLETTRRQLPPGN